MVSAERATKRPFSVIERKKSGASSPGLEAVLLTAIAMKIGTAASTNRPIWLRRRRKISRSSERRNRVEGRRTGRVPEADRGPVTSATDIEALPGQRYEDVLEAW